MEQQDATLDGTDAGRAGAAPDDLPLPPGPDGLPLVDNTFQFLDDVWAFYDALAEHGDVVSYGVGGYDFVTLLHPEHVERVLVGEPDRFRKGDIQRQSGIEFLERGLLLSEGEAWRRQRGTLQPMFYRERVESFGEPMVEEAVAAVGSWDDGAVLEPQSAFSELTLRILARTLVGADFGEEYGVVREAAEAIQAKSDAGALSSFLPHWLPAPRNRRFRGATAAFDDLVGGLIQERRDTGGDEHADLLSTLVAAGEAPDGPSEKEMRDQLMTFLFAGHETSSLALTYVVYALTQHPEVAEGLREEVDGALDGSTPTVGVLPDLTYTERVIRETLRLYPPAYVMFRRTTEDVAFGGYRVPAGTELTLPAFRLHTDPRFWDDPEAFDPSRWEGSREDVPEYAYFPFGGGPRHCIGMRFAMLELKLLLATVVQRARFDLVSDPDLAFEPAATLQPRDPIRVRVRHR
ncbi:cytochrome P450 [Halorarum salinum]|uniref:Cytochrome P450 n=1 Tax=Halorarum salinum TaxID=2743089 RepID=A0A7D5LBC6_9EURY|nr:cytochrome P450 [Halobaculum salinum]QLG62733.1 cytochrome P450 [Halobaculum salinum]